MKQVSKIEDTGWMIRERAADGVLLWFTLEATRQAAWAKFLASYGAGTNKAKFRAVRVRISEQ
jgi:hypothetical protein